MLSVSDIEVVDISPKVPEKFSHLISTNLKPEHIKFRIHNVNNAVSNAIRRTVACELTTWAMNVDPLDLQTDDVYIIPEMVCKRLKSIPILQNTPSDTKFRLLAVNGTPMVRDVKSSEITIVSTSGKMSKLPFNDNFTVCTLNPNRQLAINNITMKQGTGYVPCEGMHALGVNAVSLAIDQKPINELETDIHSPDYNPNIDGISCRIADPRVWDVAFNTNGSMPAKKIVQLACDNIIDRLKSIQPYNLTNVGQYYELIIMDESDTIGNLIMKTSIDIYPEIDAVTYSTSNFERKLTIKIRDEDLDLIGFLKGVISELVEIFTQIREYF